MSDVDRARSFMRTLGERCAERVERLPHGTAYLCPSLPDVYDRNYVVVQGSPPEEELPAIVDEAERIRERVAQRHCKLVFEHERFGERVAPLLAAMTWSIRPLWIMLHHGPAPAVSGEAREIAARELERPRAEVMRSGPNPSSEGVIRQLIENDRVIARAVDERCFASFDGSELAAWCRLYSEGRVAQIEDVATLDRFQHRGHSRAALTRALAEARAAHDVVFITADGDDWPKDWYGRLGFVRAAVEWGALKAPHA